MLRTISAAVLSLALLAGCGDGAPSGPLPFAWPPTVGDAYPDVELLDHTGATVRLADFAGKVIVVEPIGMT